MSARSNLVAQFAILMHPKFNVSEVDGAWRRAEERVAAMEAEPDKPVQCPCCEKLVTLCVKHYQLHEPGKPCMSCLVDEEMRKL